jgi:3-deoxy-D-manno-octulosonic-acid transferase
MRRVCGALSRSLAAGPGVFTESEIWPNLILESSTRSIPLALVNGRDRNARFAGGGAI